MTTHMSITDHIRTKNPGLSDFEIHQLVEREIYRRKHHRKFIYNIISKIITVILSSLAVVCAACAVGGIVMMFLNCFVLV